jgi:hypothetical protein
MFQINYVMETVTIEVPDRVMHLLVLMADYCLTRLCDVSQKVLYAILFDVIPSITKAFSSPVLVLLNINLYLGV